MTMRAALAEGMLMANSEENADVVEATMNVIVCTGPCIHLCTAGGRTSIASVVESRGATTPPL